jgi:hypothetical protein
MAISFQSDEEVLRKLWDKLCRMLDEELIRSGKKSVGLRRIRFSRSWTRRERSGSAGNHNRRVRMAQRPKKFSFHITRSFECRIINQQASGSGALAVC